MSLNLNNNMENLFNQNHSGYLPKSNRVLKLIIQEVPQQPKLFIRPMNINVTHGVSNIIASAAIETAMRNPHGAFDGGRDSFNNINNAISSYAPMILGPQGSVESPANIVNGWESRRCRFMMEVEHTNIMGGITKSVIYGYTDVPGVSNLSGFKYNVDPNMVFHINSVVNVGVRNINTAQGSVRHDVVLNHKNVIKDDSTFNNNLRTMLVTPSSTMQTVQQEDIKSLYGNTGAVIESSGVALDKGETRYVSKRDAVASDFIAQTISSFVQASAEQHADPFASATYAMASSFIDKNMPYVDDFIRALEHSTSGLANVTFTLNQLMKFDPNCTHPQVLQVAQYNPGFGPIGEQAASWATSDITTSMAYMAAQVVSNIITSNSLTGLSFMATNETMGSTSVVVIENMPTVWHTALHSSVLNAKVVEQIKSQLCVALSNNEQVSYFIKVDSTLHGDCRIQIRINGEPVSEYVCPVYADSTYSINTTKNPVVLTNLANGIRNIVEEVNDGINVRTKNNNKMIFDQNFNSAMNTQFSNSF